MSNGQDNFEENAKKFVSHKTTITDKGLTRIINYLIRTDTDFAGPYYMAICTSGEQPIGCEWASPKSSDSRQPVRDAIEHGSTTGHTAILLGPIS